MCGLVGVFGDIDLKAKKAFATMLILDTVRGRDSTGVAGGKGTKVNDHHAMVIRKSLGPAWKLFEEYPDDWDQKDFEFRHHGLISLAGHNRATTIGETNLANAHPFEFDHIVGMHNGTLSPEGIRFLEEIEDGKDHPVDSWKLYNAIEKVGVEEMYKNTSGAMALTWFDKEEGAQYFLRNSQRPLYGLHNKGETQFYWASEPWMLEAAFLRSDLDAHIKGIQPFDVNTLYIMEKKGSKAKWVEAEELKPAPFYRPPTRPVNRPTGGNITRAGGEGGYTYNGPKSKDTGWKDVPKTKPQLLIDNAKKKEGEEDAVSLVVYDVLKSDDFAPGPGNHIFTRAMFERHLTKCGGKCAACNKSLGWEDKNTICWHGAEAALCNSCVSSGSNVKVS